MQMTENKNYRGHPSPSVLAMLPRWKRLWWMWMAEKKKERDLAKESDVDGKNGESRRGGEMKRYD